jgi:hypothetical protein
MNKEITKEQFSSRIQQNEKKQLYYLEVYNIIDCFIQCAKDAYFKCREKKILDDETRNELIKISDMSNSNLCKTSIKFKYKNFKLINGRIFYMGSDGHWGRWNGN